MLDKKLLNEENILAIAEKLKTRGFELPVDKIASEQAGLRKLIREVELLRSYKNVGSNIYDIMLQQKKLLEAYKQEMLKLNEIEEKLRKEESNEN